jgi:RNA polymerase sigma factor (sigma-70 family)
VTAPVRACECDGLSGFRPNGYLIMFRMPDDCHLLQSYATTRDDAAFAELVQRHLDAVYSIALRRVGNDRHLAEDVAQQVFIALARDARRLARHPVLAGWLFTCTRNLAANVVRAERRRKDREQDAVAMEETFAPTTTDADWPQIARVLDEAIAGLGASDRDAVLLRFIERRSFAQIGQAFGIAEDAARKRVDRSLERLRAALGRRGVVSTATALTAVLTEHAVVAAPAGLAAIVAGTAASCGTALAGSIAFMSITKLQIGVIVGALAAGAAGVTWQQFRVEQLATQLAQQSSENARLTRAQIDAAAQVAALRTELARQQVDRTTVSAAPNSPASSPTAMASAPASPGVVQSRVSRLDALVHLTADQAKRAADVFGRELTALDAFGTLEDRAVKGMEIRQQSRADIRALLTPEQRRKYDIAPQSMGGGLSVDPANLVDRLDKLVALTPEQKKNATEIFWDDVVNQVSAMPADQPLRGFMWSDPVRDRLHAILTAEQQAKFDTTSPYRKSRGPAATP